MGLNTTPTSSVGGGVVDDVGVEWMKELGGTKILSDEESFSEEYISDIWMLTVRFESL